MTTIFSTGILTSTLMPKIKTTRSDLPEQAKQRALKEVFQLYPYSTKR